MKKYCINLDLRPDKWATVLSHFQDHEIEVERVSGIKEQIGYDGCRKTHLKLLSEASDSIFMVLEDDVLFYDGWEAYLDMAMSQLPEDWDMLYLGATLNKPIERYSKNLYTLKAGYTTHAIIYKNGRVIDYILEANGGGRKIDVFYADEVQEKFNCFITYPMLATQRGGFSDIINRNVTYEVVQERYNKYVK